MLEELKKTALQIIKYRVDKNAPEAILNEWAKSLIRYAVDYDFSNLDHAFEGWEVLERLY